MLRKALICLLLISLAGIAVAQELSNDVIDVKYDKKSPKMAMALSAIFPGAGQAYANPKSITTYIFPLIEIGLWYGYFHYNKQGDEATKDYEKWANKEIIGYYPEDCNVLDSEGEPLYYANDPIYRYDRDRYNYAYNDLIGDDMNNSSFYESHFKLDDTNTQHFYEDIAKYDKYIIGWADWFDIYATDSNGDWVSPNWKWETDPATSSNKWTGNFIVNSGSEYLNPELFDDTDQYTEYKKYSGMRQDFIQMRIDTEEYYEKVDNIKFGLLFNRILASFDAMRLARNHNRNFLASNNRLKFSITPVYVNNEIAPALILSKSF